MFKREATQMAQVFPNPSSGKMTVELLIPGDQPSIGEVKTPFGKTVMSFEIPANTEKYEIDLSDQMDGLYMVIIQQPKVKKQICKVFKSK